jgi:hypothetical protein
MTKLQIFLTGGLGGIASNLVALARLAHDGGLQAWFGNATSIALAMFCSSLAYLIFFGLGGMIAIASREKIPYKIFMIGVSAPALIAAGLRSKQPYNIDLNKMP